MAAVAAAEIVEAAAVDAAVMETVDFHRYQPEREADPMGNSTGSTMYMFGAVIVIYLVGVSIYQGYLWIKKKRDQKRDEEFRRGDE